VQTDILKDLCRHEFSRNIGLISESTQEKLGHTRVAVAGAGGVGGIHILTLARMGVGKFQIADLDTFERANISRQFGAFQSTIGHDKADTLARMVLDINPHAKVKVFSRGVSQNNYEEFLQGCNFLVDGIEFFEIDVRRDLFNLARRKGIPALTAAPLGFGATLQVFSPQGMTFDDYFGMTEGMPYLEKLAAFAAGLAPWPYHLKYMDLKKVSLKERRGPAVAPACTLAASLIATSIARIVAGEPVKAVPHYTQLDLYRSKFRMGYLLWGGKNPLQKLKRRIILKKFQAAMQDA
jgi:molybdopterin/thiamine biosynthesis adenylyltransferase